MILEGVAVGAGWQATVAYVNIGCYYIIGVPLGLVLGYKLDMGVRVISKDPKLYRCVHSFLTK